MMELRVEHLCKRYGENAVLDDISFTARVGVTRLLGPSGIGKTTLLRVLLGLETPDSGTVNGDKFRWTAVFQENRLLEGLDAEGNLRFVLGANYNAAAAQALLEELGLGDVGKKKVRDYSGGMQRRRGSRRWTGRRCDVPQSWDASSPFQTTCAAMRAAVSAPHSASTSASPKAKALPAARPVMKFPSRTTPAFCMTAPHISGSMPG